MLDATSIEQQAPKAPEANLSKPIQEVKKPIGREELEMAQRIEADIKGPKPDPDKALREIAGEISVDLPPVPEGMTRLYRTESDRPKFVVTPDNVEARHVNPVPSGWALVAKKGNGQFSGQVVSQNVNFDSAQAAVASIPEIETGRWFTKEKGTSYGLGSGNQADQIAANVPRNEFYIDVPTSDLDTYEHNPALSHIPEHIENEFLVPGEVAVKKNIILSPSNPVPKPESAPTIESK